jgi:hydrogenase expression/formation protein HypC
VCLAIPGRITRIDVSDPADPRAEIDYGIAVKTAHLVYTPEARVGDYVVVHAGFATTILSETEAREALEYVRQYDLEHANGAPVSAP